jgi:hypothetical protein
MDERRRLLEDYERYFSRMAENGGNLTRSDLLMDLPLEWGQTTLRSQSGALGSLPLDSAHLWTKSSPWRVGTRSKVFNLTLNMGTSGQERPWNEQSWHRNP